MKYLVLQSIQTPTGNGDYTTVGTFNTLEDAKAKFDSVKADVKGWCNLNNTNNLLETILEIYDENECISEIYDSYTCKSVNGKAVEE